MTFKLDYFIERKKLKKSILNWQFFTFLALLLFAFVISNREGNNKINISTLDKSYIANFKISGIILENTEILEKIKKIKDDKNIEGVIITIDSPGGSVSGGESLYIAIKKLAEKKPVVAVFNTIGTSAAYMAALGANRITATYNTTLVGSIGVIMQSFEMTELASKLGIELFSFKSSPLKAAPNTFEKITTEVSEVTQDLINSMQDIFLQILKSERKNLNDEQIKELAKGKAYVATQAIQKGLIDAIGGAEEAKIWMEDNKKIKKDLSIKEVKIYDSKGGGIDNIIKKITGSFVDNFTDSVSSNLFKKNIELNRPLILF